jgi:hypothetical protein
MSQNTIKKQSHINSRHTDNNKKNHHQEHQANDCRSRERRGKSANPNAGVPDARRTQHWNNEAYAAMIQLQRVTDMPETTGETNKNRLQELKRTTRLPHGKIVPASRCWRPTNIGPLAQYGVTVLEQRNARTGDNRRNKHQQEQRNK